jgi:platelet-activating factor acetylhydrolase IB subunit alpha
VIFHPVYPLLASCSDDASIRLWDYEVPEHQETMRGHTGHVSWIAFNSQGSLLASCSSD